MVKFILFIIFLIILVYLLSENKDLNKNLIENYSNSLENVDIMNNKIDEIIDHEKESRLFCKMIRNDNSKDLNEKILNEREKLFSENLKKQNDKISDIKKKIISFRLNKNNKEFIENNKNRNTKIKENRFRKNMIINAKNKIKEQTELNVNLNYNN